MADLTTSTKIIDNTRECIFAFQYQYVDSGNESAVSKIDVSALVANANGTACTGIRIVECHWILHGMTVEVLADADTDIIILHLAEDQQGYQTFEKFGGLPTSSGYGANGTGDIKFTTTGAGAAGDAYQVIIRGIKQY
jgi:hypothetical protein|tara:strand:+ start:2010 stop:2423 length:414 start_codon:yes stop_codon:yes gene_type:complete